mmetsp:Transcript_10244/g.27324  ORF Transcript_10244/g.27324 Transcript_10244/m.27324 type:complete len:86 (+) Transcript_10244:49-306(+)
MVNMVNMNAAQTNMPNETVTLKMEEVVTTASMAVQPDETDEGSTETDQPDSKRGKMLNRAVVAIVTTHDTAIYGLYALKDAVCKS